MSEVIALLTPEVDAHLSGIALYGALAVLGGGFLTVPLMNVLIGVPYALAVGSDLSMIIGTSTAGVLRHRRTKTVHVRTALWIGSGSVIGAILGDIIQDSARKAINDIGFTVTMHGLFVLLLIGAVILTVYGKKVFRARAAGREAMAQPLPMPPPPIPPVALVAIGFGVGILTGIMGIGGGVLLVPILLGVVGVPERTAAGTSLVVVFVSATVGTIKKTLSSIAKVSMPITLALLISGVVGVQIGSALGNVCPAHSSGSTTCGC